MPQTTVFTDFDALVAGVGDWLARDDLAADIPAFIWLAECELQRDCDFTERDTVATGTTVADQEYLDLPADYISGELLRWDSDQTLPAVNVASLDVVARLKSQRNGVPSGVATQTRAAFLWGNRLYYAPVPGAVDYTLFYTAGINHLDDAANNTSELLTRYSDALLYCTLMHAAPYLGADERIATWAPLAERAKESVRMQEWRKRSGHGPLAMRPDIRVE